MKRFIVVSILMGLVIALGIVESVLLSNYYKSIYTDLQEVNDVLLLCSDGDDLVVAEGKVNSILESWQKNRFVLHTVSNHAIVRNFEEKLVSLASWVECDGYSDSRVLCESAMEVAKELSKESRPQLGNLF